MPGLILCEKQGYEMVDSIDMQEFERVAGNTGVFKGVEIDLLHETLLSWKSSPGDPYTVLELRDGKTLAAYAIISKVTSRESTYDIRYFVVDRDYRSTTGAKSLFALIDEDLLKKNPYAVIRLETSGKKLASLGVSSFEEAGYKSIGHILGYYGKDDDYFYLIKTIYRESPPFAEKAGPENPEASPHTAIAR